MATSSYSAVSLSKWWQRVQMSGYQDFVCTSSTFEPKYIIILTWRKSTCWVRNKEEKREKTSSHLTKHTKIFSMFSMHIQHSVHNLFSHLHNLIWPFFLPNLPSGSARHLKAPPPAGGKPRRLLSQSPLHPTSKPQLCNLSQVDSGPCRVRFWELKLFAD